MNIGIATKRPRSPATKAIARDSFGCRLRYACITGEPEIVV